MIWKVEAFYITQPRETTGQGVAGKDKLFGNFNRRAKDIIGLLDLFPNSLKRRNDDTPCVCGSLPPPSQLLCTFHKDDFVDDYQFDPPVKSSRESVHDFLWLLKVRRSGSDSLPPSGAAHRENYRENGELLVVVAFINDLIHRVAPQSVGIAAPSSSNTNTSAS